MFKIMLCILIVICCGILGIFKSNTYNQRIKELDELKSMFHMVNMEISYRREPLPDVFRRLSSYKRSAAADIMKKCVNNLDTDQDFEKCWCDAVDEITLNSCLSPHDTLILKDFGQQLGKNSVQGHADMFGLIEERLSQQLKEAHLEKNTKGRMYSGLGFSIGIIISVLMI